MMNNMKTSSFASGDERPWWTVHPALFVTLGALLALLMVFLTKPQSLLVLVQIAGG